MNVLFETLLDGENVGRPMYASGQSTQLAFPMPRYIPKGISRDSRYKVNYAPQPHGSSENL